MKRQKAVCLNLCKTGQNHTKETVLQNLTQHIKDNPSEWIKLHYSGPATVNLDKKLSGQWCCANDEYLRIEEILQIINENAESGAMVDIIADCPGALGMFWRYKWLVENCNMTFDNIDMICFEATCDYDEVAYSTQDGGDYSRDKYRDKLRNMYDDLSKKKIYVID